MLSKILQEVHHEVILVKKEFGVIFIIIFFYLEALDARVTIITLHRDHEVGRSPLGAIVFKAWQTEHVSVTGR